MSIMNKIKVLVTSPSLDGNVNVSGIASVVRSILAENIKSGAELQIETVEIGKKDIQSKNLFWVLRQFMVPFRFIMRVAIVKPDIVHINGPLDKLAVARDGILAVLTRFLRRKLVLHVHGGPFLETSPPHGFYKSLIKLALGLPSAIVVLGQAEADNLSRLYSVPRSKIVVLPNAVEIQNGLVEKQKHGKCCFIYMGRFSEEKGIRIFIQALLVLRHIRKDFCVTFYGDGPLRDLILITLGDAFGDDFVYAGVVNGEEKRKAFNAADILVLPSLREGLPMVLLEAMAYRVAVLVTRVGSVPEVIRDGVDGMLVEKGSEIALVKIMELMIDMKRENALRKLTDSAFITVANKYNMAIYVENLKKMYRAML